MPDETPVETRPEDGARTDQNPPAAASTGRPGPPSSPADANGLASPAHRAGSADQPPIEPGSAPAGRPTEPAAVASGPAAEPAATAGSAPADEPVAEPAVAAGGGPADEPVAEPAGATGPAASTAEPAGLSADGAGSAAERAAAPPAETVPPTGAASTTGAAAGGSASKPDDAGSNADVAAAFATEAVANEAADAGESTEDNKKKPDRRRGSFLRELPVLLVVAFGLALLIKTFLVQAFFIPSGSMEQTLHGCTGCSGDRVLVNKLVYRFHDPRPGDIVVFRGPESWAPEAQYAKPTNIFQRALRAVGSAVGVAPAGEKDFVKRIIAVGGQTVQCCDEKGRLTVDGRPLDEPYVYLSDPDYQMSHFGPVKVPAGRLWMMGDHRDESADSRSHIGDADQGTIGIDDVVGKAFVIVWPPSRWDTLGTPSTFASAAPAATAVVAPYLLGLTLAVPVTALRRRSRRAR